MQDDANAVYELALCWRMTGDDRYARSAVHLIDGWMNTVHSTSQKDDSTLSFSYCTPTGPTMTPPDCCVKPAL